MISGSYLINSQDCLLSTGLGLVNRFYGSVILVSSRAVNRLTDTNSNWLKYGF